MRLRPLIILICCLFAANCFAQQYDLLIRNGRIVDGTGNPWFYGDVGVVRDRITFIGHAAENATAKRTIDAKGLVVAPGFIDMLGQSETALLIDNQGFSKLTQGVTTEITGEGGSIAPINDKQIADQKMVLEHYHLTVDWHSLAEYFDRLTRSKTALNLGTYVGAAQVREYVIGDENRDPTPDELQSMREMVEDAMRDGAMGVSTALIYAPGNYAKTEELIELAKVTSKYGGIYASHMRSEGDAEFQAMEEAFRIGREANIPVEIFHLKVGGKPNWGRMQQVVRMINDARASGLDVTADQYPYQAGATSLGASIPPRFHAGGTDAFIGRLKDPAQRAEIKAELASSKKNYEDLYNYSGPDGVLVLGVLSPGLKQYEGKTIAQIAKMQNKDPLDALMDLVAADHDNVGAAYFMIGEDDIKYAMQQPWVSVGTDHEEVNLTGPLSEGKPHPRGYGSFPRILGRYVREQRLMPLETAIRKFSSLPAHRMKLADRGELKTGYFADITIFDPDKVNDVATFEDPARTSVGIEYVVVNGAVELEHEKPTGQLAGRPLRGPGYSQRAVAADGLPPRGAIRGFVTDDAGWILPRTTVTLVDAGGKQLGTSQTRYDGRFEIPLEEPCDKCRVTATRPGFNSATRTLSFNGTNALWFGFALKRSAQ